MVTPSRFLAGFSLLSACGGDSEVDGSDDGLSGSSSRYSYEYCMNCSEANSFGF